MLPLTGMVDDRNDADILDGVWKTNYTLVLDVRVTSQFEGYCESLEVDLHSDWPLILEHEENMR